MSGPRLFTTADVLTTCWSYASRHMYLGGIVQNTTLCLGNKVAFVLGEEDKLAEVAGQTGLVGLEAFLTSVFASVVNVDAH